MSEEGRMPIELYYGRAGEAVRFRTRGMSNHELRALIFGLWHSHGEYDAGRPFGLHGGTEHPHEGVGHLIDIDKSEGFVRGPAPTSPEAA